MASMTEFTFLSSDGESQIHCREYRPASEAKGILQIAHGMVEFIDHDEVVILGRRQG